MSLTDTNVATAALSGRGGAKRRWRLHRRLW